MPKEKLVTRIVTVSAENTYGTLTAQLAVPEKPELSTSAEAESVTVSWIAAEEADNRPLPESYTVTITPADGSRAAQTVTVSGDKTSVKLEGLTPETVYVLTVYAENAVGRSDSASVNVLTAKKDDVKDPEKTTEPTEPEKPSKPENPSKPADTKKDNSQSNHSAKSDAPKTGSTNDIFAWGTLLLMNGSALVSMLAYKKRTARK